jgi:hypothetical protein
MSGSWRSSSRIWLIVWDWLSAWADIVVLVWRWNKSGWAQCKEYFTWTISIIICGFSRTVLINVSTYLIDVFFFWYSGNSRSSNIMLTLPYKQLYLPAILLHDQRSLLQVRPVWSKQKPWRDATIAWNLACRSG